MILALYDAKTRKESRIEQGPTHLAHPTPNPQSLLPLTENRSEFVPLPDGTLPHRFVETQAPPRQHKDAVEALNREA
jgi:hypothetical protein